MYQEFYGLRDLPFRLTPDPRYVFRNESYLEAISSITYGIERRLGFVVIAGEIGTGKTTILRLVLSRFGPETQLVHLMNPFVTVREFYEHLITGFDLDCSPEDSRPRILDRIGYHLARRHGAGRATVLVVDEAHGLSPEVFEEIRLLLNYETSHEKLLQVIVCGQPELRSLLRRPDLRQLTQRIALFRSLRPLESYEIGKFIRFRLKIAGAERVNLFTPAAVALIHRVSQGLPRAINNICDNALLAGFAAGSDQIDEPIVAEAVETLDLVVGSLPRDRE